MSDERKISERYRELAREEPPRHLDDAILAASRRETRSRPAPLVVPSGRRRWYFPVAAAAIIVLAVAVTVHMERDETKFDVAEAPVAQAPAPQEAKREAFTPAPTAPPPPAQASENRARAKARADAEQAQAREEPSAAAAVAGRVAPDRLASAAAVASPEQWLQGIADLRRQGRHEEADRQLAEFRKRYPDYRIPDAIRGPMEKR